MNPIFNHYATGTLKNGTKVMTEWDYIRLVDDGFTTQTKLDHLMMKIKFRKLRETKVGSGDAIDKIREEYPHLQFDTIRKIVYGADVRQG